MAEMIVKAAKAAKRDNKPYFIFPTQYRWNICTTRPAFDRQYTQVTPAGEATYHEFDYQTRTWTVTAIGTI